MKLSRKAQFITPISVCLLLFFCLTPTDSGAQADRGMAQSVSPLGQDVLAQAASKSKIPGMAVALIEHGQLRDIKVFGVRDKKSNAPVTERTVFEAGPLGEPLYAYAVLQLAAEGRFNLEAPLTTFLPLPYTRFFDPISASESTEPLYDPALNQITARRVMNHTSGMPDWSRNQHLGMQFTPGQKWAYSNEAYVYLQRVVEHVTGESFDEFLGRSVLRPARMARSSYVWRQEYETQIATGYDRSGAAVEIHRYPRPAAAATLYTTIREYAQFVGLLLASAPAQRTHESAVSLMLNPSVTVDNAAQLSWGLGFGLEKSSDDFFFFHREQSAGFQCFVIASRKTGNGVVIFTNSGNGLEAVADILTVTIGGNHPVLKSTFLHSQ
jgi:CubicO group peptidase (beta-lactamase class C family)